MLKPVIHSSDHLPIGSDPLIDLAHFYVEAISPALNPADYDAGNGLYATWESPWQNISADYPATGYTLALGGKLRLQIYATGDELSTDSLMFTLPEPFWPVVTRRVLVVCGATAEAFGIVDVNPDGTVVFKGITGATTAGIQFDTENSGGYLHVTATDEINITSSTDEIVIQADTDVTLQAGGGLNFGSDGDALFQVLDFNVQPAGAFQVTPLGLALIDATGTVTISSNDNIVVNLKTAGKTLTVNDSGGNPIFRVDEDGDLHGKTGKALTFDL